MTTFRRAHSPEQREVRRRTILDTGAEMLAEMPASAVSLNELSRRAGMAKSNVLRYFDSREAVLLELLDTELNSWIDHLGNALRRVDPDTELVERTRTVVEILVTSLVERPVLCDLMSGQAAVLEHNISTDTVLKHKRNSIASIDRLVQIIAGCLPELGPERAAQFATLAALLTTAAWANSNPPPALVAVYHQHPELACYRIEFADVLRESLLVMLGGLLSANVA